MDNYLIFDAHGQTSLRELIEDIKLGHEIEFRIEDHNYFHQPHYKGETYRDPNFAPRYTLYDEKLEKRIFEGTLDEELTFCFPEGYSFEKDFERFAIDFIL